VKNLIRNWGVGFPFIARAGCTPEGLEPREGFIQVKGGKVWYRIVGSGTKTPVLLLHGGPGYPSDYLKPLERLADERPVIFYDQLGAGRSDRPKDITLWTIERFVEELAEVRRALGLKRVHLVAHSWGTTLATEYMLTKPEGIESVMLASPCLSSLRWMADAKRLRSALPEAVRAILDKNERDGTTDLPEYQEATKEYYRRHFIRLNPWPPELENTEAGIGLDVYHTMWGTSEFQATGNLKDYDKTGRLHEITVPTLFTAGRYDEATPETVAWYQSLVPGSQFVLFENSAHMAMLEEPDRYVQVIRDSLRRTERHRR